MTPADYTPGAPIRTADELAAWLAHEDRIYVYGALYYTATVALWPKAWADIVVLEIGAVRQALVKVRAP